MGLYTTGEAADYLEVSRDQIGLYRRSGKLVCIADHDCFSARSGHIYSSEDLDTFALNNLNTD